MQLTIGYVGNFGPEHSTENEVRKALEKLGHTVVQLQENDPATWQRCLAPPDDWNLVLWTRTWHLPGEPQLEALAALKAAGIGTIGFSLDRWWGLDREHQVRDEPFFRCELVVTADGDPRHQRLYEQAGVNHLWAQPGVAESECYRAGEYDRTFAQRPVAFVGSHGEYHPEWGYRLELIEWLRRTQRGRLALWPRGRAIRGQQLANLYASTKVVVGDSCLAGGITRYWSDRIPETLGRGGFLIHPEVEGLAENYTDGVHLRTYELGNWEQLAGLIQHYLDHEDERVAIAHAGQAWVRSRHTYRHRMVDLLAVAGERGLLRTLKGRGGPVTVHGPQHTVAEFLLREGTTDGLVVDEVWNEDVYRLAQQDVAGGVVVDIGANCGAFAVWAAQAGASRVHAYEPELGNFHALTDNVEHNGMGSSIECWREGVWSPGPKEVWVGAPVLGGEGGVQTSEVTPSSLSGPEDSVPARTLSFVLRRAGDRIRLLKLDCEGCEWPALIGMDPQDLARVENLVMEFHGAAMEHWEAPNGYRLGDLVHLLAEWGHVEVLGRPSTGGSIWWRRY